MILGHERQIQYLEKVLKNGRLAHAYLFHGSEHVGKFTVAKHFIEKLSCPYPIILDLENTLTKKVPRSPLATGMAAEGLAKKRKEISIEDIRELKRLFSLAAPEGEWRIAIINQAEKLSPDAADAFLKLLEEPGAGTLFILVTSSPEFLPSTIASRTQGIRFSLVPESIISEFVAGETRDEKLRQEVLSLSAGRPGMAVRMLEDKNYLSGERLMLNNITSILRAGELPEAFLLSEKISGDYEKREKMIEYILRMLRSTLLKDVLSERGRALAAKLKNIYRIATLLDTTNVNPRLAMDVIFIEAMKQF